MNECSYLFGVPTSFGMHSMMRMFCLYPFRMPTPEKKGVFFGCFELRRGIDRLVLNYSSVKNAPNVAQSIVAQYIIVAQSFGTVFRCRTSELR